ncbi:MAG: sulfate ABC transporter permease subunit [Chlamydiae bacterium]|nr:sulfate ABC transporter permease subunit [Chlamydiota bacterium]MBI3276301.1 sulfate ABC transporter permease subunit [Chlamydiota bacterium]
MKRFFKTQGIKWILILITLLYLLILLIFPNIYLIWQVFESGWKVFTASITTRYALAALKNTAVVVAASLVITIPFGIMTSLVLVRDKFLGQKFLNGLVDLPFAAPAAIGAFALMITYGPRGLLGPLLREMGIKIIFARPGMVLATVFVTLPFIIREMIPLLEEMGMDSENAAHTLGASRWQTFRWVTFPNMREGILQGIALSYARALGEFGAILVVSGNILGVTQTLPTYIYDRYIAFEMDAAYACALFLIILSFIGRGLLELWRRRWKE